MWITEVIFTNLRCTTHLRTRDGGHYRSSLLPKSRAEKCSQSEKLISITCRSLSERKTHLYAYFCCVLNSSHTHHIHTSVTVVTRSTAAAGPRTKTAGLWCASGQSRHPEAAPAGLLWFAIGHLSFFISLIPDFICVLLRQQVFFWQDSDTSPPKRQLFLPTAAGSVA